MSVAELLDRVEAAGVTLSYSGEGDRLIAKPTSAVTPEIVAALRERRREVIGALRSGTVHSAAEVLETARGLEEASELGLVTRWSQAFGFVSIHDPTTGEWHDLQAKGAPDWAVREARKRKELYRGGNRKAYRLTSREMEEIWATEHPPAEEEGIVEDHPLEDEG